MTNFLCGKHNGSVVSAAVDPLDEFLATIGSDGMLHIVNMKTNVLVKKSQIFEGYKTPKPETLQLKWSPDGSRLYATGHTQLFAFDRKGGSSGGMTSIVHPQAICKVEVPNSEVVITYGLDKEICVWRVSETDYVKKYSYLVAKDLTRIQYCRRN